MLNGTETDEEAIEILKNKVNNSVKISKVFDCDTMSQFRYKYLPGSMCKYNYITLDTSNVAPELTDKYKFGWYIITNGSVAPGSASCMDNMRSIVGMRIFPVSMVFNTPVRDTENIGKVYVNSVANVNNNFTILVHELQAQSYIGRDKRRFHFSLYPSLKNPYYSNGTEVPDASFPSPAQTPPVPYFEFITKGKNDGWFWFKKPITELYTITISIGNPFDLLDTASTTRILIPMQFIYLSE